MDNTEYKNGQKIYSLIKEVIDVTGPRLPGSKEEKMGADIIANQLDRELGSKAVIEEFKTPRHACISAIPWLGWGAFVSFCLFYLSPILSLLGTLFLLFFALTHIFYYSHMLDKFFPKDTSQNVYASIPPKSGNKKYTVIMAGHVDSSWCWNHSFKNPKTMMIKTGLGVISVVALMIISVVAIVLEAVTGGNISFLGLSQALTNIASGAYVGTDVAILVFYCLPVLCLPGFYFLSQYLSYSKEKASPGAMDNLSGIALGISVAKYFNENPDICPDCHFVVGGLGAEESGFVGSIEFVKKHKNNKELLHEDTYMLNLDSFRDYDNFNVVKKDALQFVPFDKELIDMSVQAMKNCNVEPHIIANPIGGCDSTPIAKIGIKTVTLNAQDPRPTDYYHTPNDTLDNLNIQTLDKSHDVLVELIKLIDKKYHD